MRAREFITQPTILREYREDVTMRQYGQAILNHMLNGPDSRTFMNDLRFRKGDIRTVNYQSPLDWDALLRHAFDYLNDGDPTYNWEQKTGGTYMPWIAREYGKGNIKRLEDCASRVHPALTSYHKLKTKRDFRERFPDMLDIMRTNWEDLEYTMNTYDPPIELKDRGEYETIYDGDDARVIHPKDKAAACYYGQGTVWCTAATKGTNHFDYYNNQGPLYIVLPKKPEYQNEKYQIHVRSGQFMDINDKEVSVRALLKQYTGAMRAIADHEPLLKARIIFADPDVVTGVWNALSEIIIQHAESSARLPQFSTELTDYARGIIARDIEKLKDILNMDYNGIIKSLENYYNQGSYSLDHFSIPTLKNEAVALIEYYIADGDFSKYISRWVRGKVFIEREREGFSALTVSDDYDRQLYKQIGEWIIYIKNDKPLDTSGKTS